MKNNTQPPEGGQQTLAPSPDEILDNLNDFRKTGAYPVEPQLLDTLSARQAIGLLTYEDALVAIRTVMISGGAVEQAMDAIKHLFRPGDVVELCALHPQGGAVAVQGDPHDAVQAAEMATFVRNQLGHANLYLGICPRKPQMSGKRRRANNTDVLCRRHIVLDLDDKDAPDMDEGWMRTVEVLHSLRPALAVRTGNGWQFWFIINEQAGEALHDSAPVLNEAQAVVGADNTGDAARLMRLPFTLNIPNGRKRRNGAVVRHAAVVDAPPVQEAAA